MPSAGSATRPEDHQPNVPNDVLLPIDPIPAPVPVHFLALAGLLAEHGYCTLEEGSLTWLGPGK
jgi:hypothetical protein